MYIRDEIDMTAQFRRRQRVMANGNEQYCQMHPFCMLRAIDEFSLHHCSFCSTKLTRIKESSSIDNRPRIYDLHSQHYLCGHSPMGLCSIKKRA